MRILLKTLGVLAVLLLVGAAGVYLTSESKRGQRYTAPPTALVISASSDAYARGEYLSQILGCRDCHGDNLGGKLLGDAPPFRVEPPNLTSGEGGVGIHYEAAEWERAVRHGIGADGRGLYIMPSSAYRNLSDADMAALVAYLESVPPVDGQHAGMTFKPLGRALLAFGAFKPEVITEAVLIEDAPVPGPTAAYGGYLSAITCGHCHGADLAGAPSLEPGGADVPSLRPAAQWTADQFSRALREGFHPDGRRLDPQIMPWPAFSAMSAADAQAIHNYVRELEGLPAVLPAPPDSVQGDVE